MKKKQVAIVHFNTPELTEAAILSLRKHGGEDYEVTVFDNSDARPFTKKMDGVTVIDNTLGQVIDLDAELRKFPDRNRHMGCSYNGDYSKCAGNFGSARHAMSVQALFDILPDGFLLMDSDILIQKSVDWLMMPDECAVGHVQTWVNAENRARIDRLVPMLLWLNVPLLRERGGRFFDGARCWALSAGGRDNRANWYDTGASLLEDIRSHKNGLCGIRVDIRPLMLHYGAGSWRNNDLAMQMAWLEEHAALWKPSDNYVLGDGDWKPSSNKGAKIYICAHSDFEPKVENKVFEIVDARDGGDAVVVGQTSKKKGVEVAGSFFSELLAMKRVAELKKMPSVVGFCGYRKYFHWMSNVPELKPLVEKYGAVVSQSIDLGESVAEHYNRVVGNGEDIDIATDVIKRKYKDFAPAWLQSLERPLLHPCSMFVLPSADFKELFGVVWTVVSEYLKKIGYDVDARVLENPEKYHLAKSSLEYQRRIGGQLCERIVSAWIDWKFANAKEVPVREFPKVNP